MVTQVEPPPGSIGLTTIHGIVGIGISLGQWANGDGLTKVRHVVTYVGDDQLIEAEPGGALLSPLAKYAPGAIRWLPCPPRYGDAVAEAARALEHTPYSFLDYDALAMHRLHIPAPGLRGYIRDTGHMICSQMADHAASVGGWTLFDDGRWEGYATPGAIERLYLAQDPLPA